MKVGRQELYQVPSWSLLKVINLSPQAVQGLGLELVHFQGFNYYRFHMKSQFIVPLY